MTHFVVTYSSPNDIRGPTQYLDLNSSRELLYVLDNRGSGSENFDKLTPMFQEAATFQLKSLAAVAFDELPDFANGMKHIYGYLREELCVVLPQQLHRSKRKNNRLHARILQRTTTADIRLMSIKFDMMNYGPSLEFEYRVIHEDNGTTYVYKFKSIIRRDYSHGLVDVVMNELTKNRGFEWERAKVAMTKIMAHN